MELMTPQEAADFLKVSRQTVSIWLKKGRLPGFKMGRGKRTDWRIDKDALLYYLRKNANRAQREYEEECWNNVMNILDNAPDDDEPLTEDDLKAIEEAEEDVEEGRMQSLAEVANELGIEI